MQLDRFSHPLKDVEVFSLEITNEEIYKFGENLPISGLTFADIGDVLMCLAIMAKRAEESRVV